MVPLKADGELHRGGVELELVAGLLEHLEGVGAHAVALVDKGKARHFVAAHLPVHGDALGLHPAHGAQHEDGAVQDAEGALDLDGEVDVPRGVDDVHLVVFPLGICGGRLNRDALLALEVHRVHLGTDAVLAAHLVNIADAARVVEDALGERGLARVDVGRDPDVPRLVENRKVPVGELIRLCGEASGDGDSRFRFVPDPAAAGTAVHTGGIDAAGGAWEPRQLPPGEAKPGRDKRSSGMSEHGSAVSSSGDPSRCAALAPQEPLLTRLFLLLVAVAGAPF
mmetsp:Transcript_64569/g.203800  ORF Transcript_64569/g.203800 Transcript_64569/m.203800 type:complete len:281 (-) Transcript_64569:16-858(-)